MPPPSPAPPASPISPKSLAPPASPSHSQESKPSPSAPSPAPHSANSAGLPPPKPTLTTSPASSPPSLSSDPVLNALLIHTTSFYAASFSLALHLLFALSLLITPRTACTLASHRAQTPHTLTYAPGKQITLNLPEPFDINIAATGLKRVRFFAKSPDGRIFVTSMHDLSDNRLGSRLHPRRLGRADAPLHTRQLTISTTSAIPTTSPSTRIPQRNRAGSICPSPTASSATSTTPATLHQTPPPETLIRFPDYGLHYKYGGWHLTRTVAVANTQRRAAHLRRRRLLLQLLPGRRGPARLSRQHGSRRQAIQRLEAQGLRNAVDLQQIPDTRWRRTLRHQHGRRSPRRQAA